MNPTYNTLTERGRDVLVSKKKVQSSLHPKGEEWMWRAKITVVVSHIQRLSLLDHCFSNVLRYSIHSIM